MKYSTIEELIGKTFDFVYTNENKDKLFLRNESESYVFFHQQDCCECVSIEDICGDLSDLAGVPLLVAEECSKEDNNAHDPDYNIHYGSWTFYRFSTIKGSATIRWYGTSNGCYAVDVDLVKVKDSYFTDGKDKAVSIYQYIKENKNYNE